jgi:hypothetical protein
MTRPALRVGGVSALVALALMLLMLVELGGRPVSLLLPGELADAAPLVADRFGSDVLLVNDHGYDGQQFWAIATKFPDLDAAAPYVDNARYRFQRILTPTLAAPFGDGTGPVVALLALGVAGVGVGSAALANLAIRHGRPAWSGYLFGPPVLISVLFGLSEPLAYGLAMVGLDLADRDRPWAATAALTAGALARESVALMAGAAFVGLLLSGRWRVQLLLPGVVAAAWMAYLAGSFPDAPSEERLVPLGVLDGDAWVLLSAASILLLAGLGAWAWKDVPAVWPVGLLFVALALGYAENLFRYQVAWRANAPAITLGLTAIALALHDRRRQRVPEHRPPIPPPAAPASAP